MNQYEKIQLSDVLKIIEKDEVEDKPFLFINPSGDLATFFKYKGLMKYFSELTQQYSNDPSSKDKIKIELLNLFEIGMKMGYWVVLNMENNPKLNLLEWLSKFDFQDKDMLLPSKIKNKDYCLSQNILRKENDKDINGNYGYFEIKKDFKLVLLSTIKEDQIEELLKNNPQLTAKIIIVL